MLRNKFEKYLIDKGLHEKTITTYLGKIKKEFEYQIVTKEELNNKKKEISDREMNTNTKRNDMAALNYYEKFLEDEENKKIEKPFQRIFFGAPGTGKSFQLNEEAKNIFPERYERVTFHPNYMYGQFIGTFKPFPKIIEDSNGNRQETITYNYIPGILLKTLVKAIKNEEPQLLIIEEINRANTAAVFGDFFQLLDRDSNGESEYQISTSEDVKLYFEKEFLDENGEIIEEYEQRVVDYLGGKEFSFIKLPSNLYIWATMNSADQGVMPLDTAFKRRWDFEYFGVNNQEDIDKIKEYEFILKEKKINWNDMRTLLNHYLSSCGVPEDKLMGPYFLKKGTPEEISKMIKNKVLMYIYDDAGKAHRNKIFSNGKASTYSELLENFEKEGFEIFNKEVNNQTYSGKIKEILEKFKLAEVSNSKNSSEYNEQVTNTLETENSES